MFYSIFEPAVIRRQREMHAIGLVIAYTGIGLSKVRRDQIAKDRGFESWDEVNHCGTMPTKEL